jgi:Tfp pilus assembly protein PilO
MDRKNLALAGWTLRRLVRGKDWAVFLALALIVFDVGFYFSSVVPVQEEESRLHEEVSDLASEPNKSTVHSLAADSGNSLADLEAFYATLARPAEAPELLRKLHRSAQSHGLTLERGEYRPVPDPGGKLTRYQILLPTRGSYQEVRRFLAQAGREIPGLSLDGIGFQRDKIGDDALKAQMKFTLFLSVQG